MAEGERVVRGGVPATQVAWDFLRSSVGAKVLMAVTGAGLWGFVIIHLLGNLQIFQSAEAINEYGVFLRELAHGAFVWVARAGLALCFVLHIVAGIALARKNREARGPVGYEKKKALRTNLGALTMASSGLLILAFLVFHLSHTTWGLVLPEYFTTTDAVKFKSGESAHDIFSMMWHAFKIPWVVVVYVVGQVILLAHLIHGTVSLWQSLGIHHPTWSPVLRILGRTIGALIVIGNVAMPLAIFFVWGNPQ